MSGRARKGAWVFYLAVGLILLALPLAYVLLLEQEAPDLPAPSRPPQELKLKAAQGSVQVRKGNGEWMAAQVGELLRSSDGVRTADGSYAVLVGGEMYEVTMEPGTEVSVGELSDSISRLMLANGMATAKVKGKGKHTFEVKSSTGDALARTGDGTFSISSNGAGTVAVGTREGEVQFLGSGKIVIVRAGQQSIIRPGQGPTEPTEIPSSLLLKVDLPKEPVVSSPKLVVAGQVEPGSHLQIAEKTVRVGPDGRFSHTLRLAEGANQVGVKAKSVGALTAESHHQPRLDTRVEATSIDPNLWGSPGP
ncbi:MAG: FecR domain-containing protein [Myxococcales bacterium]|nr:FecR domain-containing protein [Myxococcales bacterium]